MALLRVNCSASACRRIVADAKGGWGTYGGMGGTFPFWEICDFPKWLQNINNVLRCKCETYLHNPCGYQIKKYPCGGYFDIKCVCHTSLKLRVALLRVNCSASACHPKRSRREGWLTIVNELRTVYYDDIINLAPEIQKVNNITTNLNLPRNYNTIRYII